MASELEKLRKKLGLDDERVKNSTPQTKSTNKTNSVNKASTTTNRTTSKKTSNLDQLRKSLGLDEERVKNSTSQSINSRLTVDDIAPVKEDKDEKKWYQKGHFEDGWDFGDLTKTLLGLESKEESVWKKPMPDDPAPEMTLEEVKAKLDAANKLRGTEKLKESKRYSELYNQKYIAQNSELLASTTMDGYKHSVLDEMKILSEMDSGKEKKSRKKAVLKKMEELGIDTANYGLFIDDGNFTAKNFGKWLGSSAQSGLGMLNKSLADTADVLLGAPLKAMGWENNPISAMSDYYDQAYENQKYNADLYAQMLGGGAGYEFGESFMEGTVAALPTALMALMTGGASATATTASLTQQAAYQGADLLTKAGMTGASMIKNPQYWMSFARTYGSDYEEAIEMGADEKTAAIGATLSSLINAGLEIGLDGASGIQGLPQEIAEGGVKKFIPWLSSNFQEGLEEGGQKLVNETIAKTLYDREAEVLNPIEYAQEMFMGTLVGGALGGGQIAAQGVAISIDSAVQKHNDNILTEMEQKVVDKVYEDKLAEKEEKGEVSNKDKKALYQSVVEDMKKGYISTDTIEEVLGGETYKSYKDTIDNEDALQQEFDTLNKMKQGDMTGEQIDRRAELKEHLAKISEQSQRNQLKTQLGDEVFSLVKGENGKGSRLLESYNEVARRRKVFKADLSKYDSKYHATIQNAIDSGLLNNTNRSHEMVDFIAKISADKGVPFNFANNAKIKETGFAVEGAIVNGYRTADGITINVESPKYLQSTVGHEITHVLEGTELYDSLKETIFNYAKTKGEYDTRLASLTELYKDVKDADIEGELAADLVGDYLFQDSDFVNRLSTENRNVFQKIYDEVKYLCKVVTAGSKEARELEKVKKAFDDAYRTNVKGNTDAKTQYSLAMVDAVQPKSDKWSRTHTTEEAMAQFPNMWNVAADESEVRNPTQITSTVNSYRKIYNFLQNEGFNGTILDASSGLGYGTRAGIEEYGFDVEDIEPYPDKGYKPKYQDYSALDKKYDVIISNAVLNVLPQDQRDALAIKMGETLNEGGRIFINVRGKDVESLAKTGKNIHLGNMEWIETVKGSYQKGFTKPELVAYLQDALGNGFTVKPTNMFGAVSAVVQKDGGVKYSLSDSTGKVLYTGSPNTDIQQFKVGGVDGSKQTGDRYGRGVYLTTNESTAKNYAGDSGRVYKINADDLNIFNLNDTITPEMQESLRNELNGADKQVRNSILRNFRTEKTFDDFESAEKFFNEQSTAWKEQDGHYAANKPEIKSADSKTGKAVIEFTDFNNWENSIGNLTGNQLYDALKSISTDDFSSFITGHGFDGIAFDEDSDNQQYVVYRNEDRLRVDNGEAKYSLSDSTGRELSPAVAKRFGNSKAVDENGNLKVLYHGTASGEFTIFDKTKGSVEGDFGSGFYFTDNEADVSEHYEGGGPDFENKVARRAEQIEQEEDIDYEEAEKRARDELYKGSHKFEVYLNIENPAVVGDTMLFDNEHYLEQYNEEDYEDYDEYIGDVEQLLADDIENIIWEVEKNVDVYSTDGLADVLYEAYSEGGIGIEELKDRINQLYLEDNEGNFVGNEVVRQIIESLGYDGIIDPTVSTKWNMDMESGTTHYIVFKPNQIKSVTNQNPTDNPDIHRSLSNFGETPKKYGNFATPAKDIAYEGIAPVQNVDTAYEGIPIGKLVRASDRGNYGYVEDYDDATGLYSVRFTSETGSSAVVEFAPEELTPIDTAKEVLDASKEMFPNEPDVDQYEYENAVAIKEATEQRLYELSEQDLTNPELAAEYDKVLEAWIEANTNLLELNTKFNERVDSLTDADAPPERTFDAPVKPTEKVAEVLTKGSKKPKNSGILQKFATALVDKGSAVEKLSLDTGNMELQAKWNSALPTNTDSMAQYFMEHGNNDVRSLKSIMKEVGNGKRAKAFGDYLNHLRNIDSMTLEERLGLPNIPVFGNSVTADISRQKVAELENLNPEFKRLAQDIYNINNHLLDELVKENLLSQESADYLRNKYPHYVPIKRDGKGGFEVDSSVDSKKASVSNTIKTATGGNGNLDPLANAMAERIQQHYRAIARNRFGIELKNTLDSVASQGRNLIKADDMLDAFEGYEEGLLKPGRINGKPTFTVFEDGKRVEFEITDDLYDALKPASKLLSYRNAVLTGASEVRRKLLTVWNPVFSLYRNPIKDMQDVMINSQHPVKTYANVPNAMFQLLFDGKMANEYHKNGGKSNTYYDSQKNEFKVDDKLYKKVFGLPFRAIETAGEFIEQVPRLAEYIASRKDGRSVERSMLDASRVTTNFAAGGDFTKFLNSHGCTFLNASVQGAAQHVRNFREATKLEGFKGLTKTLAKYVIAGVPAMLFNGLLWEDDEEYEELNEYVKDNYYVVAKTSEGKFIRIPKGRTAAVMHQALEQMEHLVTGDDEADFSTFYDLFMDNIAPNNPLTDNMFAPIFQAASNNAWYSADIVPSRLQDLPTEEQFDESTDSISKWLGEKLPFSPMKINYLLDQYSGGIGDVVLPMLTPETESGDDSFKGNMLAPWKKEITTDSVLNNKNPGEFFDLADEVKAMSNSKIATEEDKMKSMYLQSVGYDISDLYAQKREIQSGDESDAVKYEKIRELQEQINVLAKNAINSYEDVTVNGLYSEVADKRYNYDAKYGKWYEISPKNADGTKNWYYDKEQKVTKGLGISYAEYWNNKEEYNFQYDYPEKHKFLKSIGISASEYLNFDDETKSAYSWVSNNPKEYTFSKVVTGDVATYKKYTTGIWDLEADKDANGKTIYGSKKTKVVDYLNNLDADYGEKIILFKKQYPTDDTYNYDIIEYLNGRDDVSYQEMETILKELGFKVDSKGNITW